MKARAEGEMHRRGLDDRELKRGRGGIRDIEFAVQLLQLVHGRHDPSIRSAQHARRARAARRRRATSTRRDAAPLRRGVPVPPHRRAPAPALGRAADAHPSRRRAARTRLARVLGYRDRGRVVGASSSSTPSTAPHQAHVRSTHEKLFFGPLLETLVRRPGPLTADAAEERLRRVRLPRPRARPGPRSRADPRASAARRGCMRAAAARPPRVVLRAPDPDLGLLQLRRLAEGPARGREPRERLPRLARRRASGRAASSGRAGCSATRSAASPSSSQTLGDDDVLARGEAARASSSTRRSRRVRVARRRRRRAPERAPPVQAPRAAAHRVARPARLRRPRRRPGASSSTLAEACLEAALVALEPHGAVRGDRHGPLRRRASSRTRPTSTCCSSTTATARPTSTRPSGSPTQLLAEIGERTPEGQTFAIDADAPARGQAGPAHPLARGLPHLLGALGADVGVPGADQGPARRRRPRARPRGSATLAEPFVYRDPFPEDDVREVRRMKARIEQERIPPGEDPQFHLKLGRGSLSDVEFTVQLLQLDARRRRTRRCGRRRR